MEISPISGALGAEISGIDISKKVNQHQNSVASGELPKI
tara:strand:- start:498 stop:614 length:117 start_codon:yes stop_codon:yes gene_type:complete